MPRLFPKLQSKLKKVHKKLGPILPLLLAALLGALLLWGIGALLNLFWLLPTVTPTRPFSSAAWFSITPPILTATVGFLLGALAGAWYFVYRPNRETVQEYWEQIPAWVQATTLGIAGGLMVTMVLLLAQAIWGVSDLVVLAGLLVTWPAATGMAILKQRCIGDGCSRSTAMRVGYTHAKGLESRTMAIILGSIVGVLGGLLTWLISVRVGNWQTPLPSVVVGLLFWLGITMVVYERYDKQTAEQTNLSIIDVNQPETRETREIHIKNASNETIDLSLAKVRDTKFDLYKFGVDTDLGPGEICTFNAPAEFRLAPNDDSWELPLGYTLKQGSETPAVLTRSGEMYGLQRDGLETGDTGPADTEMTTTGSSQSGGSPETTPSTQD